MIITMLYNILVTLGFIGLSIYFDKWYLVFIALLFVRTYYKEQKVVDESGDNNG